MLRQAERERALVHDVRPAAVFTTNLLREAGGRLDLDVKSGAFRVCTLRQLAEGELAFIERLEIDGAYFYGMNLCGVMPTRGRLMLDKPRMPEKFLRQIAALSEEALDCRCGDITRNRRERRNAGLSRLGLMPTAPLRRADSPRRTPCRRGRIFSPLLWRALF